MKKITLNIILILMINTGITQPPKFDSLKLLLQKQDDTAKVNSLIRIGNQLSGQQNDLSIAYLKEALNVSSKIKYTKGEIKARSILAFCLYKYKSDFATSLNLALNNIKRAKEIGENLEVFMDTRTITWIYREIGDKEKQKEYFQKLQTLLTDGTYKDSSELKRYQKIVNLNKIDFYYSLPDSAKYYAEKLFTESISRDEKEFTMLCAIKIAVSFYRLNNTDSAIYYYHLCIPYTITFDRNDLYSQCLLGLGNIYLELKKTDSAFYYANQAFNLSITKNQVAEKRNASLLLSKVYYEESLADSAYRYLNIYLQLKDSILNSENFSRIQNINLQEALTKQQEEQAKKEAVLEYKSRLRIYLLIAGLSILSIVIFIVYRNSQRRLIANKKLERAYQNLKSTQTQLIQSEKMASLGELTAGIAHEIQNPLNFVNNFSEVNKELIDELKSELNSGNKDEAIFIADNIKENEEKINHHGKRADAIVKNMLQHSRSSSSKKEPTDINGLADEYLRLSYHGMRAKDKSFNVDIKTDFDENVEKINIIPQDIGRVLLNLYNNAFYALAEKKKQQGESYEPAISVSTKKIDDKIEIRVKDNGNGIHQKVVDKIFQPFFTTKPTGQGTGLGLSLSYDIIKANGGGIKVETREGEGSEFIIKLSV